MKKILINLKDWLGLKENIEFAKKVKDLNIIIFPSNPYLYIYKDKKITIGAQDISSYTSGAHTGLVSAKHLKELGIKYAIINHNELLTEDSTALLNKVTESINNEITPVLCLNEDTAELQKIETILNKIKKTSKIILAFEPIRELTIEEAKNYLDIIKTDLKDYTFKKIIYGGNVSKENIKDCETILDVDGYLISRHALEIEELTEIINNIK